MAEDNEIIQRVLEGDIDHFERLVEKYQSKVFGMVARRIPEGDREIVAQDAFLSCFRSLDKFNTARPFENWLATITTRKCHDYWRQKGRIGAIEAQMGEKKERWFEAASNAVSLEEFESEVRREDSLALLNEVLEKLSPDDRLLVDMIYLEEMKLKDVAEALGLTLSNVKVKVMRARGKMRKAIEEMDKSAMRANNE
jgi:RNA polymerase sigma-70 factor (ECF subfamily)